MNRTEEAFWAVLFLLLATMLLAWAPDWPYMIVGAIGGCAGLWFAWKVLR